MKDIMKLDPPATIVVAGHSTLRRASMATLTVRVTNIQGFFHDMLLLVKNVTGLCRHLFSGGTAALEGINTVFAKELYLDVGQSKIPQREDIEYLTLDYLDLELAPRGNYQTEAAFPTRVISGHTIPTGSALASRLLRSRVMGVVAPLAKAARPFTATSTAGTSLSALQTTASNHGARLISGGTMRAASTSTATTSFAVPTITPGLVTATTIATPAMPTTAMAAAGSEHLPSAPGTSERELLAPALPASERAHHAGRTEHRSQFHELADRV